MSKKMINVATSKMVELYQSSIGRSIRRLQKRLAKKAILKPEHRFSDLFNLMYSHKWVQASLKLVLANKLESDKLSRETGLLDKRENVSLGKKETW